MADESEGATALAKGGWVSVAKARAVVVDDEPLGRANVVSVLGGRADVQFVGEAASVEAAVRTIEASVPDVVFLDVRLPDGDGFAVLERLAPRCDAVVVFVTAYDVHAIAAFEAAAIDYVLKPFSDERLHQALDRALVRLAERRARTVVEAAASRAAATPVPEPPRFARRITVRDGERYVYVSVAEIDWIEADGNLVKLHGGLTTRSLRLPLKDLVAHLDPAMFVRIHRSTVVRLAAVKEIQQWFGGEYRVLLNDGTPLTMTRTYRDEALRLFR